MIPKPFLRRRQLNAIRAAEAANARALADATGPRMMVLDDIVTAADVAQAIEATPAGAHCPKCGRGFATRHVPHFHLRSCQGVSDAGN